METLPSSPMVDAEPLRSLADATSSEEFLAKIPRDFARQHLVCSIGALPSEDSSEVEERLAVSARTPGTITLNVGVRLGHKVSSVIAEDEEIARLVDRVYDNAAAKNSSNHAGTEVLTAEPGDVDSAIAQSLKASDRDLLSLDGKGPVIRLVDAMLFEALSRHASDIHIQPLADRTLVRYRVDGVLFVAREVPHTLTHALISRIKVMAQMDVAERNAPQDGRATVTMGRSRSSGARARAIATQEWQG